ncbi:hypothetical protein TNCV_135401 [Trichonephila clavipes]|nr:hypothetical protein TNCV_135401 [Trichonephila clavipes]
MIYSESDSENELDESRSPSPLHYPPSIDDLRLSVNSCTLPSVCLKSSQDINGLIKNVDNFNFKDKSTKKKYTDDLHALIKRCRNIYEILQEHEKNPGEKLYATREVKKSRQNSVSPDQNDEAFKTVKGRKKKKKKKKKKGALPRRTKSRLKNINRSK